MIPILQVRDARASELFYRTHFGFAVDWEHQFEPGFPLMMSISWQHGRLFLSEHAGTGTRRCDLYAYVDDVDSLYEKACATGLKFENGPVDQPWQVREVSFVDPDGHRVRLGQLLK